MGFLCKKGLVLSGRKYMPGDIIPGSAVLSNRASTLVNSGCIARLEDGIAASPEAVEDGIKIEIPVLAEEGTIPIYLTADELAQVFTIMQSTAKGAANLLKEVTSEDMLLLITASDSRSAVQKAATEQAARISAGAANDGGIAASATTTG